MVCGRAHPNSWTWQVPVVWMSCCSGPESSLWPTVSMSPLSREWENVVLWHQCKIFKESITESGAVCLTLKSKFNSCWSCICLLSMWSHWWEIAKPFPPILRSIRQLAWRFFKYWKTSQEMWSCKAETEGRKDERRCVLSLSCASVCAASCFLNFPKPKNTRRHSVLLWCESVGTWQVCEPLWQKNKQLCSIKGCC